MKEEEPIYRGNEIKFRDKKGKVDQPGFPETIDVNARDTSVSKESNQQKKEPMSDFIDNCRVLVAEDNMTKVLGFMMNALKPNKEERQLYYSVLGLSGRFNKLEKGIQNGTLRADNISIEEAKIRESILHVIDAMEKAGIDYADEDRPEIKNNQPKSEPQSVIKEPVRPKANDKLKILFLAANPSDGSRLKIAEECSEIETVLKMAMDRDRFEMKSEWAVTPAKLQQAILDENPNIVHFSGHGEEEGILLQDGMGYSKLVNENALTNLFSLFKDSINCVVLNSCYSKNQAEAIARHIKYVIGMKKAVPDSTAKSFAVGFYRALGAGKDMEFAYQFGINAVQLDGISGDDIPLLFRK